MSVRPLGYRAEQVAAFTLRYFIERGHLPTQDEICAAVGIGLGAMQGGYDG